MIKVRLSYYSLSYGDLFICDLNTKCRVPLSEIEDYDNFGWLELTDDNLQNVCEYCAELGIEPNGSISDFRYWYSDDQSYRLAIKSDSCEDLGLVNKIFEIELGLWKSKLSKEVNNLKRITNSPNH